MTPGLNLDLLLLEVLSRQPLHGYALITELRDRSGGVLDYPEGTIYPALHRLEAAGHIRSSTSLVDGRRRRVYALRDAGQQAREAQRAAWHAYVEAIEAVLGPRHAEGMVTP